MVRTLLVRGMLAGVVAAAVMWVFARLFAEPSIESAIGFEENAAGHDQSAIELVSRGVQTTTGLGVALLLYGVAIGGIVAMVFAATYGRILRAGPRGTSALLCLGGFIVVFLVPFLKYPANPPATSEASTIGLRTLLYLVMIGVSVALAIGAVWLARRLTARFGPWAAGITAALAYVVGVAVVSLLMPAINEVPAEFPAAVLYDFRLASVGNQAVLWATLGLLFGYLADRVLRAQAPARPSADAGIASGPS